MTDTFDEPGTRMGEPRTLGELLAEMEQRWQTSTAEFWAEQLRNILHGTDEAPGLVERVRHESQERVRARKKAEAWQTTYLDVLNSLTAEIATEEREG